MPCEDHEVDFHFFVGPDGLMAFAGGLPSTMAAFAVCAWAALAAWPPRRGVASKYFWKADKAGYARVSREMKYDS